MNRDTLHALLLDRALGELNPEVEALLDAYLAQNPAAAADVAHRVASLVHDLRVAIAPAPAAAPAKAASSEAGAWSTTLRRWRRARWRAEALSLAAGLAVGLWAGWSLQHVSPSAGPTVAEAAKAPEVATATLPVPAVPAAPPVAAATAPDFWERARADAVRRAGSRPDRDGQGPAVTWTSPVKFPTWEKTR